MANRAEDWFRQARQDLDLARQAASEHFEWACFAAQQAAEKALKAVYQQAGAEARGHSVLALLRNLPGTVEEEASFEERAKELDRHYIPARYPNAYPQGAPYEYYTRTQAETAISFGDQILRFCEGHLAGS